MAETHVDEDLWEQFHTAVNMTSRELSDWLRESAAGTETEEVPELAGPTLGRAVLSILRRRRTDLTPEDAETMAEVVDLVQRERGEEPEPVAGAQDWRHRLMDVGHDPLK